MPPPQTNETDWLARLRAEAIQPFAGPAAAVLEYGIRDGLNLSRLAAGRKLGFTRDPLALPGIEVIHSLSGVTGMDLVLCRRVLEDLANPAETLAALRETLKPGGRLLALALYDPGFHRPRAKDSAAHLFSWNVQTLSNLLAACGYDYESGGVRRRPNEAFAARLGRRVGPAGFRFGAVVSRLLWPDLEVAVAAARRG